MFRINILTLFPEMFVGPLSESIIKRAIKKNIVKINYINIRDYAEDKHKTVDDTPYGGGAGMVLKVDVIDHALQFISKSASQQVSTKQHAKSLPRRQAGDIRNTKYSIPHTILMTPQGKRFNQRKAEELAKYDQLTLICGHYEGFDERIREHLIDEEISLGDFVLSGGEIAAMAITDAIIRLLPGVLGKDISSNEESFSLKDEEGNFLLEYPQYTKPFEYKGWKVPEVLLSGNHAKIKEWRQKQAKKKTEDNQIKNL